MYNRTRAALSGIIGGLLGGWVKLKCESLLPPRADGRAAPPAVLIKRIAAAGGLAEPSDEVTGTGTMVVHWAFSAVFGGIYGMLAEETPIVRTGGGSLFGLAVWIGAHELTIPATGLSPQLPELPAAEQRSEAFSHVGYGVSLELVRSILRTTVLR